MHCFKQALVPLFTTITLSSNTAHADASPADGLFDSVLVYAGQAAHHRLHELPERIGTGRLEWEKTYLVAVGLDKTRGTLGKSFTLLEHTPLAGVRHGYELLLAQHHGLQGNAEIGAAYLLRTPDLQLNSLGINFAMGAGLSYALGTPYYEKPPKDDPNHRYHAQFLILFELEFRERQHRNLSLVTRVHHRSDAYELVAPQKMSSNFLGIGMRYRF